MRLNFKIVFMLAGALLLLVSGANAATLCGGAQNVVAAGFNCEIGGLVFSNFSVLNAGNNPTPQMFLVTANVVGSEVFLNFNPSMATSSGASQDTWFYFQVTGRTLGWDLSVGGTGASITEKVCATAIDVNAGNNCTGGSGNLLGIMSISSSNSSGLLPYNPPGSANTAYIFKNILLQSPAGGGTAELSSFSESFLIPEPLSFVLLGSGLLGLGILRRRKR